MNKTTTIVLIVLLTLLGVFVYSVLDTGKDVKLAESYIKEYRFAKALDLLTKNPNPSPELRQLLFFAAIKAS